MKILVINGPNINMLGIREPAIYGLANYESLCNYLIAVAKELEIDMVSRHGEKLNFDKEGFATCPATGEKYQLVNDLCKLIDPKL